MQMTVLLTNPQGPGQIWFHFSVMHLSIPSYFMVHDDSSSSSRDVSIPANRHEGEIKKKKKKNGQRASPTLFLQNIETLSSLRHRNTSG